MAVVDGLRSVGGRRRWRRGAAVVATAEEEAPTAQADRVAQPGRRRRGLVARLRASSSSAKKVDGDEDVLSKTSMLRFYGPALGIFLAGPLMSNMDNAVVGKVSGVGALAALSPGTVLADQILFLFSFLGRAATGLVSREYGASGGEITEATRDAVRRPLALAFAIGAGVLVPLYIVGTGPALELLGVDPALRRDAARYAMIRGLAAPLALSQSVALSALLAVRDAKTPLRVIAVASMCNLSGDLFLCCWPFRLGPVGAAAATTAATAVGAVMMLRALKAQGLLGQKNREEGGASKATAWYRDYFFPPKRRVQQLLAGEGGLFKQLRAELGPLFAYAGPLTVIVLTRLLGFSAMQRCASTFGVEALAAYQVLLNGFILFAFFAEPLSQTAQALIPMVLLNDAFAPTMVRRLKLALRNLAILALAVAPLIAMACTLFLRTLAPIFSSSEQTLRLVRATAFPAVFATVAQLTLTTTIDGCIVAARDFGWIVALGTCTCAVQLASLRRIATSGLEPHKALPLIFFSFAFRLLTYSAISAVRVASGHGPLGRALRQRPPQPPPLLTTPETTNHHLPSPQ